MTQKHALRPPDAADVARLTAVMTRLGRGDAHDRWLVAVSGGVDSMALLTLCAAARGKRVSAITVDHGLRPQSAAEAAMVADHAAALGIAHRTIRTSVTPGGNLHHRARAARYDAIEAARIGVGARWVLTAHHADDQLETVMMRLARGAGPHGLAAIRQTHGAVTRPVLAWRRAELQRVAIATGTPWCDDPSNRDERFDRARWRRLLEGLPIDPARAVRSASACAEGADALDWMVGRLVGAWEPDTIGPFPIDAPIAVRRLAIMRVLDGLCPAPPTDGPSIDRLMAAMANQSSVSAGAFVLRASGGDAGPGSAWRVERAPARKDRSHGLR